MTLTTKITEFHGQGRAALPEMKKAHLGRADRIYCARPSRYGFTAERMVLSGRKSRIS
jgi:hypothetical protein